MKRFLLPLIMLLVALGASATLAVSFTAPTTSQVLGPAFIEYGWNVSTSSSPSFGLNYTYSHAKDSLNGADTVTLLSKYFLNDNSTYYFQITDSAGTADTIRLEYQSYDLNGNKGAWTVGDSIKGIADNKLYTASLPSTLVYKPSYISVRAIKWTGTLISKIRRFEIVRCPIK
jgi:hypothetical protein